MAKKIKKILKVAQRVKDSSGGFNLGNLDLKSLNDILEKEYDKLVDKA